MSVCPSCGAPSHAAARFCTRCGATLPIDRESASAQHQPPGSDGSRTPPTPAYVYAPSAQDKAQAVMSTGAFVLALFLMSLPVAGLVLQIIWACGGTANRNRVHLARAYLIISVVGIIAGALLTSLLVFFAQSQLEPYIFDFFFNGGLDPAFSRPTA